MVEGLRLNHDTLVWCVDYRDRESGMQWGSRPVDEFLDGRFMRLGERVLDAPRGDVDWWNYVFGVVNDALVSLRKRKEIPYLELEAILGDLAQVALSNRAALQGCDGWPAPRPIDEYVDGKTVFVLHNDGSLNRPIPRAAFRTEGRWRCIFTDRWLDDLEPSDFWPLPKEAPGNE